MVSQKVTINNPQGLHMRPAGVFAKGMAKFDSDVTINFNGKATNGKIRIEKECESNWKYCRL